MAKQFVVRKSFESNRSIDDVTDAVIDSFGSLGGVLTENVHAGSFDIINGSNGISGAFCAKFNTAIRIRQKGSKFLIQTTITREPNWLFWVCLFVGIFLVLIPWVVCILYLFVDPTPKYQSAMDDIEFELGTN